MYTYSGWANPFDCARIAHPSKIQNSGVGMRYYFHLFKSGEAMPDRTGLEINEPSEVRAQAEKAIRELQQETDTAEWVGWTLSVADSSGRQLFALRLSD